MDTRLSYYDSVESQDYATITDSEGSVEINDAIDQTTLIINDNKENIPPNEACIQVQALNSRNVDRIRSPLEDITHLFKPKKKIYGGFRYPSSLDKIENLRRNIR